MQRTLYEFPLNERTRNFMRLEAYFAQLSHFSQHPNPWDSQICLFALIELLNIIERSDIRSEVSKELDRNIVILSNLFESPSINVDRLRLTLDELQTQLQALRNVSGKIGASLRNNDLINSVKQRLSISGVNKFEVPSFYSWLNQEASLRQDQLCNWIYTLKPLEEAILLLNRLLRNSAVFETKTASEGFYQQTLSPQQACQMVRVTLPPNAKFFPETSGNKHRISIRFLQHETTDKRPVQLAEPVEFDLSCCNI